jgi:hypothetical protein
VGLLDVALAKGAQTLVVVNPMVPIRGEFVVTGHGDRPSVCDKGSMWVVSQANRLALSVLLAEKIERISSETGCRVILIEPKADDAILFTHNPARFAARRTILEHAYRTTRERAREWLGQTLPPPPPLDGEAWR